MLTDNPNATLILVVEDDENHVELIQRSFEVAQIEYRMEIAGSLLDAWKFMEQHKPDLIMSDCRLPDGDGNELVVMADECCPVILMTSYGNEQLAVESMKVGAQDYIVKSPETFSLLPGIVSLALREWNVVQERRTNYDVVSRGKRDWERTFDAVPEMISIIDINNTITRVNRPMAERFGLTPEEMIGRKCCEVVHHQENPPGCCPVAAMMQNGMLHSTEIDEKRLNCVFDVTVSPLSDDEGSITAYVHVMRDITRQRKTEELVHQRLKLRDIASSSSVDELMQATLDACELLTDSSIGFYHLIDEDQQTLKLQVWSSNTLATMCTAERRGNRYPISQSGVWAECCHSRKPVIHNDYENLPSRKGLPAGHPPLLREMVVPFITNDKAISIIGVGNKTSHYTQHDVDVVSQFLNFASDVIERKKAIIALEESEERHRKLANEQQIILNTSSVGICLLKNRKVVWANPAFDLMFGYEIGTTYNMDTAELYTDKESYEETGRKGYSAIASGVIYSQEVMMHKKDGSLVWSNLVGQAVNPGNMEDGSIWIFLDITERKYAEEERQKLEQQYQQTQKLESLGVLAGGIAHDFNNILSIILGHCYIIDQNIDSEIDQKNHVKQIERAAGRAADLCRQMLSYAGKNTLVQTGINLWLLVDETVKMLQSGIKKNVDIKLDLKCDVPIITGDSSQIQQVVMNLIINAAEAIGDKNGAIKIELKKTILPEGQEHTDFLGNAIPAGNYAFLTVSDNGCGMEIETQLRIFEPFYTTKFTGRGLGMSAILGILKSHNGSLQLSSTPCVGSVFKVFLPLPPTPELAETTSKASVFSAEKGRGSILLADDEESLRIIGSSLLKAMGFSAVTAANGREALELYRKQGSGIDLILLDMIMPEMGGIETYRQLREMSSSIPIVVCSGYSLEEIMEEIVDDQHAAAIQKPYNPDQLRNTLMKLLDKKEWTSQ